MEKHITSYVILYTSQARGVTATVVLTGPDVGALLGEQVAVVLPF